MKYCILYIIAVVLLLGSACNEDEFLSYDPVGRYSVENFYSTETQITGAVNSSYQNLRNLYNNALWQSVEMRSDNTTFIPNPSDRGSVGTEEIDYFVLTSSSGLHGNIYNVCYAGISKVNYIINRIAEVPFDDETEKAAKEGEARFLRAFYYYVLTQSFGDVVKVTEIIESEDDAAKALELQRSPRQEAIDEIILPDLDFAINALPAEWSGSNEGRATRGAAQMLLAKILFTDRKYAEALPLLDSIIDSRLYQLESDYRNIFAPSNNGNSEIIFANQASVSANQGAAFFLGWLPFESGTNITQGIQVGTGASKNIPTCDLLDTYEAGDKRLDATIGYYDTDENDPDNELIPYSRKFLFTPVTNGGSDIHFPVFRYADVLLMKAEAIVETQGGLPDEVFETLNVLRNRASLPVYFPGNPNPDLDLSTTEELRAAVRKERRLELAYENHRFWDLMRYENVTEVMLAHGEEQKIKQSFLDPFPTAYQNIRVSLAIPFNQVDRFGYRQNAGW